MTVKEPLNFFWQGSWICGKASGDAKPCGPHDMAPVYEKVLGIDRAKLEGENLWSLVRRLGLSYLADWKQGAKRKKVYIKGDEMKKTSLSGKQR